MSKIFRAIVATAVSLAATPIITAAVAADAPATVDTTKLASGLTPLVSLVQLMDTNKNGKISKDEFMRFMQAEFDFADKNKDGQLDPNELKSLVHRLNHPTTRQPSVRK